MKTLKNESKKFKNYLKVCLKKNFVQIETNHKLLFLQTFFIK